MNFAKQIAEKIKKEKIKPISSWYFSFKNLIFWTSFCLSLALGSVAFSFFLVALIQNEFSMAMLLIPILWIIALIILIVSALYFAWHTKTGYKIPSWIWIGGNIFFSIFLGMILYISTFDKLKNEMMEFSGMKHAQESFWNRPEEGFLSGKLKRENEWIILIDKENQKWYLQFSDSMQKKHSLLFQNTSESSISRSFLPSHPVKIEGEKISNDMFFVEDIKPLMRGRMREEEMQFMPIKNNELYDSTE